MALSPYTCYAFTMKKNLSNLEKKALRAKAHSLKPSVVIGPRALTEAVLAEIDAALNTPALITVRRRGADKINRTGLCEQMEKQLNAEVVDQIGFIAVLHRPESNSN